MTPTKNTLEFSITFKIVKGPETVQWEAVPGRV